MTTEPVDDANEEVPAPLEDETESGDRQTPRSLVEYLKGKSPASQYVDALSELTVPRPDETSRAAALNEVKSEPALLARLPELMRAASGQKVPSGLKRALLGFGAEVIRNLVPEQERWGQTAGLIPEALLAPLVRNLRNARKDRDKVVVAQAEALLVTGLVIALDRHDFDPAGALSTIHSGLKSSKPTTDDLEKLRRTLAKASVKSLEAFALLRHIIAAKLEEASEAQRITFAQLQDCRERLRMAQDEAKQQAEAKALLQTQVAELTRSVAEAEGSIASVQGGAAHDRFELKGQIRRLMQSTLAGHVEDALEALREEPHFVDVARERLETIAEELKQGVAWLDR